MTAILDMEDSVAAVDADDKSRVYRNICGVFRGSLEAPFVKDSPGRREDTICTHSLFA